MMNLGKEEEEEEEVIIYGDVLESILSKVPLVELASSCCSLVSREWKAAVSSSLRHLNPAKPWLFIHTQATRTPYSTSTRAYDPRSRTWVRIHRPCIKHVSTLRSAHSSLLYMLSPSRLSFSSDPFHLTWHHADSPFVWRTDPIVALLGTKLIVAGGGCDFEDDPLAVEIYDLTTKTWDSCEFMPAVLKDSSASTCLSVATDDQGRFMFVVQRQFGIMHTFDSDSNIWTGPFDIRPPSSSFDHQILVLHVTFLNGRLILIGLIIMGENKKKKKNKVSGLKVWWVDPESLEREEIGEMPKELLMFENEEMCSSSSSSSISASSSGNWVFIYNNNNNNNNNNKMEAGVVYVCEVLLAKEKGGGCRWSREEIPMMMEKEDKRVVFTCSQVTIPHLNLALRSPNWKFQLIN